MIENDDNESENSLPFSNDALNQNLLEININEELALKKPSICSNIFYFIFPCFKKVNTHKRRVVLFRNHDNICRDVPFVVCNIVPHFIRQHINPCAFVHFITPYLKIWYTTRRHLLECMILFTSFFAKYGELYDFFTYAPDGNTWYTTQYILSAPLVLQNIFQLDENPADQSLDPAHAITLHFPGRIMCQCGYCGLTDLHSTSTGFLWILMISHTSPW